MNGDTLHTHPQLHTSSLLTFHPDAQIPGGKDNNRRIYLSTGSGIFPTFPLSKPALSPYP